MPSIIKAFLSIPKDETRRLVTVQRISKIKRCTGTYFMEVASVSNYQVAVPERCFKVGQLVVYIQIDSFLPAGQLPFQIPNDSTTYQGMTGHHVKARMVGKEISQGTF